MITQEGHEDFLYHAKYLNNKLKLQTTNKFPGNKAPGLDGLPAGVLKKCWCWLKECVEVIQSFWNDGILTLNTLRGVIRLIPKKGDLTKLNNWRPITLMSLLYKIVSKILANRLKQYMSKLVDL